MIRLASAIWKDGMKENTGVLSTESGSLKGAAFAANPSLEGRPIANPEELLAAAIASSFSLALSGELDKACLIAESIRVVAGLTLEQFGDGWTVTQVHLDVTVKLSKDDINHFEGPAKAAQEKCGVLSSLKTKVTMDAKLEVRQSFGEMERKSSSIPLGSQLVTVPMGNGNESGEKRHVG